MANFDTTDWNCWEIVQNPTVREYTSRRNSVENIIHVHKVILYHKDSNMIRPLNKGKRCSPRVVLGWVTYDEYPVLW